MVAVLLQGLEWKLTHFKNVLSIYFCYNSFKMRQIMLFPNFLFCAAASKVKNASRESSLEAVFGNMSSSSSRAKSIRQQKSLNDHLAEQVALIHRDFGHCSEGVCRAKENKPTAI